MAGLYLLNQLGSCGRSPDRATAGTVTPSADRPERVCPALLRRYPALTLFTPVLYYAMR